MLEAHVGRAGDGDETEEHEHADLPEAGVAVRPRAAGVEPRRCHAHGADRKKPWRGGEGEGEAGDAGEGEAEEGRSFDRRRRCQAAGDETDRADPNSVSASHPVGEVVGVVHADLQCE